jgi:hypothetical protein
MYVKGITGIVVSCFLFSATGVQAESFKILGSRALGMGGAFVAVAEDSLASYWNPAALAGQRKFDVEIPVNVKAEFTGGILKDVNTIGDLATQYKTIQSAQRDGGKLDVQSVSSLLQTLETLDSLNKPDKGVLVEAHGGFDLRIMRVGIAVNNFTSVGGTAFIDTKNIGLGSSLTSPNEPGVSFTGLTTTDPTSSTQIEARNKLVTALNTVGFNAFDDLTGDAVSSSGITTTTQLANALVNKGATNGLTDQQILDAATIAESSSGKAAPIIALASSGNSYSDNTSNLKLRGISLFEVGVGYAHRFFIEDLYLGGNLKALLGQVGYFQYEFLKDSLNTSEVFSDYDQNVKQSIQPGVDLGMLYDKREKWRFKLGVIGRNLNSPKFDQPSAATGEQRYRVEPQVRAGLAIYPFKRTFWVIASDIDLTNNITPVPGFASRMWGLGTEINLVNSNLFNLGLRAGITTNLAEENSKVSYTGGVGVKFLHFFVDIAGAVSSQTEEIKSGIADSQKVPQNLQVGVALGLNF